jgi:hypothetical protein
MADEVVKRPNSVDVSHLSHAELLEILDVLDRDAKLRIREQLRVSHLAADLQSLRRRGMIRSGHDSRRSCARCRKQFSLLPIITGLTCVSCNHRVCSDCCSRLTDNIGCTICIYCYRKRELEAMMGSWLRTRQSCDEQEGEWMTGSDVVRAAIVQSVNGRMLRSAVGERRPDLISNDVQISRPLKAATTSTGCSIGSDINDNVASGPADADRKLQSPGAAKSTDTTSDADRSTDLSYNDDGLDGSGSDVDASAAPLMKSGGTDDDSNDDITDGDWSRRSDPKVDGSMTSNDDVICTARSAAESETMTSLEAGHNIESRSIDISVTNGELHLAGPEAPRPVLIDLTSDGDVVSRSGNYSSLPTVTLDESLIDETETQQHQQQQLGSLLTVISNSIPLITITDSSSVTGDLDGQSTGSGVDDEDVEKAFASYVASCDGQPVKHVTSNLSLLTSVSGSMESISTCYSNAFDDVNYGKYRVSGEIEFGVTFVDSSSRLEVAVKQCRGLTAVDTKRNTSNPYVKCYLLPDKTKTGKRKTKVKKRTIHPVFDQLITYRVTRDQLPSRVLCLMVWNSEKFGRNDFIGEVCIDFGQLDGRYDLPVTWYQLQEHTASLDQPISLSTNKSEISLAVMFQVPAAVDGSDAVTLTPATRRRTLIKKKKSTILGGGGSGAASGSQGELKVTVKEASQLAAVRSDGLSDFFCSCCLLPDRQQPDGDYKTNVASQTPNPAWNHTFTFRGVSVDDLRQRGLELIVWDHSPENGNDFVGGVRLSLGTGKSCSSSIRDGKQPHQSAPWMDATNDESTLWRSVIDRPNCWIEVKLSLRSHLIERC